MAQLGNLIVTGVTRLLSKLYVNDSVTAPTFIGKLQGNADTATKATQDSGGQQINTTYIKGLSVSGKTITYTKGDGTTGTITTQDTNTTYPMYTKTIDGSYASQFRTQTKGDTSKGGYITAIRNETESVVNSPRYGSGIAFGMGDTHGYLYYSYNNSLAYVGAGDADKLNWTKQLAFTDSTVANASKVNNHTVNSDVPSGAKFTDTVYTHPASSGNKHIPSGGSSGQILRWSADGTAVWGNDNNTTYSVATTSKNGLMSSSDKAKLDGIEPLTEQDIDDILGGKYSTQSGLDYLVLG